MASENRSKVLVTRQSSSVPTLEALTELEQPFNNKLETEMDQFKKLCKEISSLKAEVANGSKMRALEWGIKNVTKFGNFSYRRLVKPNIVYESSDFVRSILIYLRTGKGIFIDENIYVSDSTQDNPSESMKESFRIKLSEQIYQLTGQKPRIELKDGRCSIHYS